MRHLRAQHVEGAQGDQLADQAAPPGAPTPAWATAGDLWNALSATDPDSKLKRGMLVVSR